MKFPFTIIAVVLSISVVPKFVKLLTSKLVTSEIPVVPDATKTLSVVIGILPKLQFSVLDQAPLTCL